MGFWIVLTIIITLWLGFSEASGLGDWLVCTAFSAFVSFLISLIVLIPITGIFAQTPVDTRTDLIAVEDNFNYYLYRRSDDHKYTYLYEIEDKGITSNTVDANFCYLNYINENETPYVIIREKTFNNSVMNFMFLFNLPFSAEYSFYVPEGSITSNFNIDLN